jgi:hypothetical protein
MDGHDRIGRQVRVLLMGVIGTPDEYEAYIVDSLTQETQSILKWSSIDWQRIRNATSTASVRIAPYDTEACRGALDGLTAWGNMLAIVRNGQRVWDGPVMGWSTGDGVTIRARDRSAMLAKRLVGADITYDTVFTYDVFTDLVMTLLNDANMFTTGAGGMPYTYSAIPRGAGVGTTDIGVTVIGRLRVASLETLASVFASLTETVYFGWTQVMSELNCYVDSFYLDSCVLSSETVVDGQLALTVQGDDIFTGKYKGATGQGIAGFVSPAYPVLDSTYIPYGLFGVVTDATSGAFKLSNFAVGANLPGQYDSGSPSLTLETLQLRPDFGSLLFEDDLSTLVPGCGWGVDFPNENALDVAFSHYYPASIATETYQRVSYVSLEQLDVSVSRTETGLKETMQASVRAVG